MPKPDKLEAKEDKMIETHTDEDMSSVERKPNAPIY